MKPDAYFLERDPTAFPIWQKSVVGIAGAGGLGSNIANLLARAGVGKIIIADHDVISISNLNRQAFTLAQVGQSKVQALKDNILQFNPFIDLEIHKVKLDPVNIPQIFSGADLMLEALDTDVAKAMLLETWLQHFPEKPIIAASGLAGYGHSDLIRQESCGNLH
ncbi:MAG TPA: sulfur carrier protein ThiS adenylyltransferase ThiF, partial [Candidatus Cloacimonadota bacterium]|nr:sulfur carrier protein ThiS adenylyltransferase ThiF [Candidatus Cloacimonadota bacterium]